MTVQRLESITPLDMIDVLHVVKTRSLVSDGRVIKWITSLRDAGVVSEVVVLEDENIADRTLVDGYKVDKVSLVSRRFFGKRKGYWIKVPEYAFLMAIRLFRLNAGVVVFHDVQQYLNLLIMCLFRRAVSYKILWDLHELPHDFLMRRAPSRWVLGFIMSRVDAVIVPNRERQHYIQNKLIQHEVRYIILNNYPENSFVNAPMQDRPDSLVRFLDGNPYVLWMGVASRARNFQYFIHAFSKTVLSTHKLVIVGSIDSELRTELSELTGDSVVYDRFVPQSELVRYIDGAAFSVVLYAATTPNNWFCEPNRLYQLITRGVPVICGHNPTLARLVGESLAGVVLPDDGSNVDSMVRAISHVAANQAEYKRIAKDASSRVNLSWEDQFSKNVVPLIIELSQDGGKSSG